INTILYRLYVRAPSQPAYAFSGKFVGDERANYGDVIGVMFDGQNRLLLGHKGGVAIFDGKGALASSVGSNSPSAFFVDAANRIFIAREGAILDEKGAA